MDRFEINSIYSSWQVHVGWNASWIKNEIYEEAEM